MEYLLPKTGEEYMDVAKSFSSLTDAAIARVETISEPGRAHEIALRLPMAISLVNAIGYFRGDDGGFYEVRPQDIVGNRDAQSELYAQQDTFERRLQVLIDEVLDSKEADFYRERLQEYFVRSRSVSSRV